MILAKILCNECNSVITVVLKCNSLIVSTCMLCFYGCSRISETSKYFPFFPLKSQ